MTRLAPPATPATLTALVPVLALIGACTVHHVHEHETDPNGGGVTVATSLRLRVGESIVVGSGASGPLATEEGQAVAHPFVAHAGTTVRARLENTPHAARVSLRGPIDDGVPERATVLASGDESATATLPRDGVYLAVVEGAVAGGALYELFVDCQSEECRVTCSQSNPCPSNARCYFVQCVTTPCPSYCQVDLPAEETPPVASDPGEPCGSRGMAACAARSFCDFPIDAACGEVDHPGRCAPLPTSCPDDQDLVCACDGRTYVNACQAHMRGVSVRSTGACPGSPLPVVVDDPSDPEPTDAANDRVGNGCMRTGCSRQICTEVGDERTTTCEMRPEYRCLEQARCEHQPGGGCGWTETPEFQSCMDAL